ncbi:CHC2 zinc finger domain-containing protein [Burkholderia territorii]|uniref:CHC2 zinc finger domain-containing protein n=2 Tax=Burkholderiaceae TaxID=119060 RepID=UPI0021C42A74|nr:CHC2 zinc finger domain-containing protein [Burkholderia territorii]
MKLTLKRGSCLANRRVMASVGRHNMPRTFFNRDCVPPVAEVLARLQLQPSKPNGAGYAQVRCPIHGENHASLSIHFERGNWRCFACGEAGGDALELYRRARGLSFAQAARELGAWEGK